MAIKRHGFERGGSWARAALVVVLVLSLLSSGVALQVAAPRAEALTAGLPSHFAFGLHAPPGDNWPGQSGIPWDFRYTYLSGGVNTNAGWEVWNTNGQYPLYYAQTAAAEGRTPMFPYYELLQSSGNCGSCAENRKDITNLNTPSLMRAYYQNFALLMKRIGTGNYDGIQGFGKTAIINVEPDFTGGYAYQAVNNNSMCFGYCTGQANNPSLLKASVASSGYGEVGGYPDTFAGYTRALSHLRDLYAPNVLLGWNISNWATATDIGMDTNPYINSGQLGQQLGAFLNQTGAHDILFNDPLDRDAGQYKAQFGQNRWWDRLNVSYPNFRRWEQYVSAVAVADGTKSILLWQVPIGNQYFATVNNTNGHFQDNRAEYIFAHIPELIQSGIVGVMFGAGNSGNTVESDATRDGVTNAPSFCTTDGVSSGQICNNHTSTVSDDDGGFLRMQGQAYYQNPLPLGGSPVNTPTPTATAAAATYSSAATASPASAARGGTESFSATVTSSAASTALVDLEVYDGSGIKVFQQFWDNQAFSSGQTRTYSAAWPLPTTASAGAYAVAVGVFAPGWASLKSWNGSAAAFSVGSSGTSTSISTPTNTPTPRPTSTPTPRPTNTPLPTSTPTSAPVQPSFTSSATVSPAGVVRGNSATITTSIKSATAMNALIDVEVYDASSMKVFQQFWDSQSVTAGQIRTYTSSWSVPLAAKPGTYTVKIGVFATGWSKLYHWNNNAATITVT